MASINIQIRRGDQLDDFWSEGMLSDATYVRALVFDGLAPAEAIERLAKLKEAKCSTPESPKAGRSTGYLYTTDSRR